MVVRIGLAAVALLCGAQEGAVYRYTDRVLPSKGPPGGLKPEQVPLFVVFGSDDNYRADGIRWLVESFYGAYRNPAGSGNAGTFDGVPCRGTFYMIGKVEEQTGDEIRRAVHQAWRAGHEIGNHTYGHNRGGAYSEEKWRAEISRATEFLSRPLDKGGCGVPGREIVGFRAPYDEHGPHLWPALKALGFLYDCSVHEGFQPEDDGTNEHWPYTLDQGSPGGDWLARNFRKNPVGSHPGLWELPEQVFRVPPALRGKYGIRRTADDWTLFNEPPPLRGKDLVEVVKHTVDLRLKGNRAPLFICIHGQFYGTEGWFKDEQKRPVDENRAAMMAILRDLVARPEVRVVRAVDVVSWLRNPVPLGAPPGKPGKEDR